jgi:hypothetical protein
MSNIKPLIPKDLDPSLYYIDENNEPWFKFGVDYRDDNGRIYGFELWAKSHTDAERRLQIIRDSEVEIAQIVYEEDASL